MHPQETDHPSKVEDRPAFSVALRNAGVFIAVAVGGMVVLYLRGIITPLVIALFLLMLIDGFDRAMETWLPSFPSWFRSTLGAALTVGGFAIVVGICAHDARSFVTQMTVIAPKIDALLAKVSTQIQTPALQLGDLFRLARSAASLTHVFGAARGFVSESVLVVIYLGFLLFSRGAFGRKLQRMFSSPVTREHVGRVFARVRSASEQYVGLQTLKAALVAAAAFVIMRLMGLTDPLFLALILFLAAYVPIVGGIAAAVLPSLVALGEFDSPYRPLALFALLGGMVFVIENILLPKLQSDRLNIDPVFVLLSLGFWGALLGPAGALLSTPLTVVVMAVAGEFEGARWLAVLLSKDGELITRG
ncbi:MAG: AI-2E family transporter [Caulobacteraceae bacterium]|nr:AI-2E family transporter [Caulobacteraceae bacterium]